MKKESMGETFQDSEENKKSKLELFNQERYGEEGFALKRKRNRMPTDFESLMSRNDLGINLREKYGQKYCENVMAFHILIGSTPTAEFLKSKDYKFDFDGEDSIEKFIDQVLEESEKKKT